MKWLLNKCNTIFRFRILSRCSTSLEGFLNNAIFLSISSGSCNLFSSESIESYDLLSGNNLVHQSLLDGLTFCGNLHLTQLPSRSWTIWGSWLHNNLRLSAKLVQRFNIVVKIIINDHRLYFLTHHLNVILLNHTEKTLLRNES